MYVAFAVLLLGLVRAIRLVPFDWLAANLVGLGLALSVAAVAQAAFIDKSDPLVYGFWRPAYGATPFGPFVNKNHFAGWMVMVLPVALSYLVAMVATAPRPSHLDWAGTLRWAAGVGSGRLVLVAASLLIMSTAVVLTGSRSGMVSLVLALGVVGVLVWTRPETRNARRVMTGGVLALGGGAVLWAGLASTLSRFGSAAGAIAGRWGAWQDSWHIVRDFLAFGTGLGTYGRAMLVYQTGDRTSIYAQAHNDYLQLLAEGGLLVIIPAIIAAGVIIKTIGRRLRSADDDTMTHWLRAGAVAGLRRYCRAISRRVQLANARQYGHVRRAARPGAASPAPDAPTLPCASRLISTACSPTSTSPSCRPRSACFRSSTPRRLVPPTSARRRPTRKRRASWTPQQATRVALSNRQADAVWKHLGAIENFWESLSEIEPGAIAKLAGLADERGWEVIFITSRPQSAGRTVQRQSQRWIAAPRLSDAQPLRRARIARTRRRGPRDSTSSSTTGRRTAWTSCSTRRPARFWSGGARRALCPASARRMGIGVVSTVDAALSALVQADREAADGGGVIDRLRRLLGLTTNTSKRSRR